MPADIRYAVLITPQELDDAQKAIARANIGAGTGGGGGPVDLNNAALTGATTAEQISPVAAPMGALAIDVTKARNTKSVTADSTFTFSATPPAGAVFGLRLTGDGTPRAITIPSSYSTSQNATITGFTLPANGTVYLCWEYTGSGYNLTGEPFNPSALRYEQFEHFINGSTGMGMGFTAAVNAGGTTNTIAAAGRLGVVRVSTHTGTSGNERSAVWQSQAALDMAAVGEKGYDFGVQFAGLPGASLAGSISVGLINQVTAVPSDGIFFRVVNGGNLEFVTVYNATETATDLGYVPAVSTNYILGARINSAASSVQALVGGVVVATHSTNIPKSTDGLMGLGVACIRTSTTGTPIAVDLDWAHFRHNHTAYWPD